MDQLIQANNTITTGDTINANSRQTVVFKINKELMHLTDYVSPWSKINNTQVFKSFDIVSHVVGLYFICDIIRVSLQKKRVLNGHPCVKGADDKVTKCQCADSLFCLVAKTSVNTDLRDNSIVLQGKKHFINDC